MTKWKSNSAQVIGLSHIERNMPCQDATITLCKNNVNIIVLSDGCGSEKFAEYGSKNIVSKASEYICDNFESLYAKPNLDIKKELTSYLLNSTLNLAKEVDVVGYLKSPEGISFVRENSNTEVGRLLKIDVFKRLMIEMLFDATLLFVAIKDDRVLYGHCGDGFILGYKDKQFIVLSEEEKEEQRNVTNYLSVVNAKAIAYKNEEEWNNFRIGKINNNSYIGFIIMSDGAEKSLVSTVKESIPSKDNNLLLLDIVYNETKENGEKYLLDILETQYREINLEDDIVEITDDDVSVAILVSSDYIPDIKFNDSDSDKKPPNQEESKHKINNLKNFEESLEKEIEDYEDQMIDESNAFEWQKKLYHMVPSYMSDKRKLLEEIIHFTIKSFDDSEYNSEKWNYDMKNKYKLDLDMILLVDKYLFKLGLLDNDNTFNLEAIKNEKY